LSLDADRLVDALYEIFDAHVGKRMEVIDAMEVPGYPRSRSPHA
jgi:hypothetical protein